MRNDHTRTMELGVVGREGELASVRAFVEQADGGLPALVLEGEPGSASRRFGSQASSTRVRGARCSSSRPAEAERGLTHAGLGDLFEDVFATSLPDSRRRRRRALEGRAPPRGAPDVRVDHRALAVAVRDVLQLLSDRDAGPRCSRRRSVARPVVVERAWRSRCDGLAAEAAFSSCSPGGSSRRSRGSEHALCGRSVERVPVGPLSVGALHRLLGDRFGRSFATPDTAPDPRAVGRESVLCARVGPRARRRRRPARTASGSRDARGAGPRRLQGFPPRRAMRSRSPRRSGAPSESLLEQQASRPVALEPALAARVVERENGTIRFTHPLLSSALYPDLGRQAPAFTIHCGSRRPTPSSGRATSRCRATGRTPDRAAVLDEAAAAADVAPRPWLPSSPSKLCG